MSALGGNVGLFKGDWIADPDLLARRMRVAGVADRYTAELASLRFDAVRQRGSRDNDYLTAATPEDIERLMERLGRRFAPLGELMQPRPYVPKKPVRALPLAAYVIRVPLVLDQGTPSATRSRSSSTSSNACLPPS